jgi:hypothetical protein
MSDLTELKLAAEKATPGFWSARLAKSRMWHISAPSKAICFTGATYSVDGMASSAANADYIVKARPAVVITLIDQLSAAQAEIARLRAILQPIPTKVRPLVAQTHEVGTNSALAILQPASFEVKP